MPGTRSTLPCPCTAFAYQALRASSSPRGTSLRSRWCSCLWLQRASIPLQTFWGMCSGSCQRLHILGCQEGLRSSQEMCRIKEPLVLSLGLMNPQCPPQDLHCRQNLPKSVVAFCNYQFKAVWWQLEAPGKVPVSEQAVAPRCFWVANF